jgi:hypothetical protein
MAQLPNADRAVLDLRKVDDYCLNPAHPRGRHKARVFRDALGIGQNEAGWLRQTLLAGVRNADAVMLADDAFGTRWRVDVPVARQERRVVIRTIWIVRGGEQQVPRFVTCWVL